MVFILGVIGLLGLVIWLYCLFDALTTPREYVHTLSKATWVVVILVFSIFGAVAWLLAGRPRSDGGTVGSSNLTHPSHPSSANRLGDPQGHDSGPAGGPVGPDDDPEFLRRLDRRGEDDDDA